MEDEDKEAEKKNKIGDLGTPARWPSKLHNDEEVSIPTLDSVPFPSSSPVKTSVEGANAFTSSTSAQDQDTRRKPRLMGGTSQKGNQHTEQAVKIIEGKAMGRMKRTTGHLDRSKSDSKTEKPHICENCGNGFVRYKSLLTHIRRKHSEYEERKHECEVCKLKFLFRFELRRHCRTHQGDINKHVKCPECGVGFTTRYVLSQHRRRVHNHISGHSNPSVMSHTVEGSSTTPNPRNAGFGSGSDNSVEVHTSISPNVKTEPSTPPPQNFEVEDVVSCINNVEPHQMEVSEWPESNLLLPENYNSHQATVGDFYCVAPNPGMQPEQMMPPMNKPEPERLIPETYFLATIPIPITYPPTNEVFLVEQNFLVVVHSKEVELQPLWNDMSAM